MTLEHFDARLVSNDLVQDLKWNPGLRRQFEADLGSVLDRYELTAAERSAIEQGDYRALYEMGLHPYLLAQLARLLHGTAAEGAGSSTPAQALMASLRPDRTEATR